ncbi:MAG TPA: glycoside hydrolase family 2 TIM barrel-domain containing protein [Terracidiphilus sp.]|nr:glycoside hydrolase family 2 TIM barrel-domain containing protein [Terracidiphilus sp.]
MDRRDFLKSTGTVIAAATVASNLSASAQADTRTGRMVLPINRNWRYSPKAVDAARARVFDDSKFERVVVPHTNLREPWHSFDEKSYEFVSVYRRRFRLPAAARSKRVFVDFEGVMTASKVWVNGTYLGEYKGGYTPFSFELTQYADHDRDNVLVVEVDSSERSDIPPFGDEVDYLTFGGIYREVQLRVVPATYIENIFAQPRDVLSGRPTLDVECFLESSEKTAGVEYMLEAALYDGEKQIAKASQAVSAWGDVALKPQTVHFNPIDGIELWELHAPKLYRVEVKLMKSGAVVDSDARRIGFREAKFTPEGFKINGKVVKLRGLDRHQMFPWVGQAMPGRVQRRDAKILREELKCNIVRTSHYPQSRHFLDECDEVGLLVLEEIPGWQHIGDQAWQDISVDNVRRMIRWDWNHPSIVLWGVRINESRDNHDFYTRTNAMAHKLDPTRQTGGIRYFQESEFLEDVFTMNDFGFPLKKPNHPLYLNTEFVGHTYPTKTIDNIERLREHTIRHARVHDQLASDPQYAGGIGWCAFDYNTHANFGSGDRICYHGVTDIWREPKPAAGFYRSQCEPEEEIVLAPSFHWARGDENVGFTTALVSSNCEHLKFYVSGKLVAEADPDREQFKYLKYPPFSANLRDFHAEWGDLRIEGYIGGKLVATKTMSGKGVDQKFMVKPDDTELEADGADTTRVVLRVTDEYDAVRPFACDAVKFELSGPATLIGDNPFTLVGGQGAVWVRAGERPGKVTLTAHHPYLGAQKIEFTLKAAEAEEA